MIAWFESLPTGLAGVLIVGGFVGSCLVMGYLVAKFTSQDIRQTHNDRAGFILAVIGVIYAVLLAFVAIGVWERFQEADVRSYDEAGALATVYRGSDSFPDGGHLRGMMREYVRSIVDVEWPLMRKGDDSEFSTRLPEMVEKYVRQLPVTSMSQSDVHAQMITSMETALMDRQTRLTVDFIGISGIMWFVLVAGAYVTVAFTYLFGFERTIMQQLMIGGLSLIIGLVLFLVLALDYPYRGGIAVQPHAFQVLLEGWKEGF
ncbi:MAG TPA: hypothetical protein VHX17_11280 [Candidatus Cybelea sp.]|jgi:hypothetical protein|nr:hypothetical protein [Candidatus Cybelea sp.]